MKFADSPVSEDDMATLINEIVRRILSISNPEQIILFGSYARGNPNADSDLDLLIIERGVDTPRRESLRLRRELRGLLIPIDVIVATPQQIKRYGDSIGLVYGPALSEGRLIYERAAST